MEYLRHKYSGRIYVVRRDHSLERPYLWSPWDYTSRFPKKCIWDNFFTPCEKPPEMPRHYDISIAEEREWEKAQMPKGFEETEEPIRPKDSMKVEKPQKKTKKPIQRPQEASKSIFTLKEICDEIGMEPSQARRLLRSSGRNPSSSGWVWDSPREFEKIRKFLKKSQ